MYFAGAKIVKGECRSKWETNVSRLDYAEPPPILYKDNANREQNDRTCSNNYAEMQLIF